MALNIGFLAQNGHNSTKPGYTMKPNRQDSDDNQSRRSSIERGKSRFFVSEVARAQLLGWMVKALSNKRIVQQIDGGHSSIVLEHAWIFQFIDIIYVGTIFKLSHLIGLCGRGIDVYVLCVSYFAIMFSTRLSFDVYTCVSGASGILHLIAFCFYGMGVFIMTVNISSNIKTGSTPLHDHAESFGSALTGNVSYGSCERSIDYDTAFAVAFIFTRGVLIIMYGLYFYVFHESNQIGHAPEIFSTGLRLSDLTRDSESEAVKEFHKASFCSLDQAPDRRAASVDHFRPGGDKLNAHSATPSVDNPIHSAPPAVHRSSFVMRVTRRYGASAVKIHFRRIFTLKVAPVILSSIAMCTMFAGVTPVIVLPFVAFIEFVGDFLPSYFVHHAADWKEMNPSRHFLEERLGLFFMLVLGEMVLGFSAIDYSSGDENQIYKVLLFSFFTIFTVGMQYFEPLQSYTKPEGPHPLDVQQLNPVYIWLVCLTSFFMLVAGNGMVELYGQVAGSTIISLSDSDLSYQKEKVANGLGTVTILMIFIKILDKVYYRERLLPDPLFSWLDAFYKKVEAADAHSSGAGVLSGNASVDSDFDPNRAGSKLGSNSQNLEVLRASTVSSMQDGYNNRASFRVITDKADMAMGIRRIRPLTALRLCISVIQFILWKIKNIAVEDYMTFFAATVVLPSLVEVVLEVRHFLQRQFGDEDGEKDPESNGRNNLEVEQNER